MQVNIVVSKGHTLGLTVRGGKEFSLGIYISGVDPFSVAESAGLKVTNGAVADVSNKINQLLCWCAMQATEFLN